MQSVIAVIHTAVAVMHERSVASHEPPLGLAVAAGVSAASRGAARRGLRVARRQLAGASLFHGEVAVLNHKDPILDKAAGSQ
jgi:hypothetical protein